MKPLGTLSFLALTSVISFTAIPLSATAQNRICVESERDGRIVCGRQVRDPNGGDRPAKGGNTQCGNDFDEEFYLIAYPDVAAAVRRGQVRSGCDHYLKFGRFEGRLPRFSESSYLSKNPDVANAVRRGQYKSGYDHWLKYGRYENRQL
jgi:hypothetical protein